MSWRRWVMPVVSVACWSRGCGSWACSNRSAKASSPMAARGYGSSSKPSSSRFGILDIIHAVTHVFAAATAVRERSEGWPFYREWITWIWRGELVSVITALQARQQELGEPTKKWTRRRASPHRGEHADVPKQPSVAQNYPTYRTAGLPLTRSHMESTMR